MPFILYIEGGGGEVTFTLVTRCNISLGHYPILATFPTNEGVDDDVDELEVWLDEYSFSP